MSGGYAAPPPTAAAAGAPLLLQQPASSFRHKRGLGRIAVTAFALGFLMATGIALTVYVAAVRSLGLFLVILSGFHMTEFVVTAYYHPLDLSFESFLVDHSRQYHVAMTTCFLEYSIEAVVRPSWKAVFGRRLLDTFGSGSAAADSWPSYVALVGLALCLVGQAIRTVAMITAAANFTHQIAEYKTGDHRLVSNGIYACCRHPSYGGWFLWSIGTQLLLVNPVCTLGYVVVSWQFFRVRIAYEERHLHRFFGVDYVNYCQRVPFSGVPFVS